MKCSPKILVFGIQWRALLLTFWKLTHTHLFAIRVVEHRAVILATAELSLYAKVVLASGVFVKGPGEVLHSSSSASPKSQAASASYDQLVVWESHCRKKPKSESDTTLK